MRVRCELMRTRFLSPLLIALLVIFQLYIDSSFVTTPAHAEVLQPHCIIGSSTTGCEAYSPQEIYNLYGTVSDGTQYISVVGTSTPLYVLMNRTNTDNGSWILLMKGVRGSANFGYSSSYFTSSSTTLSTNSLSNDVSTDAKFSAYNSLAIKKILAVFKDPASGTYSSAGTGDLNPNGFGGHVWLETLNTTATAFTTFTTATSLATNAYTNTRYSLYRESNSASATQVFSYQNGYAGYGFNQTACSGKEVRWGIYFNNESDWGSCDSYVGIGLGSHSPGDQVTWTGTGSFAVNGSSGKGNTGFQIWGKMSDPAMASPQNLSITQSSTNSVTASWQPPASGSVTEYVVQYKSTSGAWIDGKTYRVTNLTASPSVSISGISPGSYDFRVWARNSSNSQSSASPAAVNAFSLDTTAPTITGPSSATGATSSISIAENTTAVFNFTANETVTWAKGGTDGSFFAITSSGVLTVTARDFETKADANADNIYIVTITATDSAGNATIQTLYVTITNVNEAPSITINGSSANHSITQSENISNVLTYTATDPDAAASLTWSLSGTDAADFIIGSSTGILSFASNPDFEAPLDSNADNIYVVVVQVSDGSLSDTQTLTVTITNANESSSLGTPSTSGVIYKGVNTTITVASSVAGKVRFFVDGKRISTCLARPTSGSYPNYSATCTWKPAVTSRQNITASITPTDNTYSSSSSPTATVWVQKRVGVR